MPRDSNGVHTLSNGYRAVDGETILASQHNPPLEDLSQGLTDSLPRNGSAPMLAALNFGSFKGVNVGTGVAATDAANVGQIAGIVQATDPKAHTHPSSQITDFSGAVDARISAAVGNAVFNEAVDDRANALLIAGQGLTKTYDDTANTLTFAMSALTSPIAGAIFQDIQPSGTAGAFLAGPNIWGDRILNTEVRNVISGVSSASNQITLPAGSYWIAIACSQTSNQVAYRLQNITDAATALNGPYHSIGQGLITFSGPIIIAATKTFAVQHYGVGVNPANGFAAGIPGRNELYTTVQVWRQV